jgi:hypothetical protein
VDTDHDDDQPAFPSSNDIRTKQSLQEKSMVRNFCSHSTSLVLASSNISSVSCRCDFWSEFPMFSSCCACLGSFSRVSRHRFLVGETGGAGDAWTEAFAADDGLGPSSSSSSKCLFLVSFWLVYGVQYRAGVAGLLVDVGGGRGGPIVAGRAVDGVACPGGRRLTFAIACQYEARNVSPNNGASIPIDSVVAKADEAAVLPFESPSSSLLGSLTFAARSLTKCFNRESNFGDMALRSTFDSKNGRIHSSSDDDKVKSTHDSQNIVAGLRAEGRNWLV